MEGWDSIDSGATQDFAGGETDPPKRASVEAGAALGRSEWIRVEERLPEIVSTWGPNDCFGGSADVLTFNGSVHIGCRYASDTWATDEGSILKDVTHWQPLPKPPEAAAIRALGKDHDVKA